VVAHVHGVFAQKVVLCHEVENMAGQWQVMGEGDAAPSSQPRIDVAQNAKKTNVCDEKCVLAWADEE